MKRWQPLANSITQIRGLSRAQIKDERRALAPKDGAPTDASQKHGKEDSETPAYSQSQAVARRSDQKAGQRPPSPESAHPPFKRWSPETGLATNSDSTIRPESLTDPVQSLPLQQPLSPSIAPLADPLHLFRHLLRQSSYLPDPVSRTQLPLYIKWRFHATTQNIQKAQKGEKESLVAKKTSIAFKQAKSALLYLRRANNGHIPHLRRVLLISYGRTRRRRHQLLDKIMPLPAIIAECANASDVEAAAPQLMALIRSQAARPGGGVGDRVGIKRTEPPGSGSEKTKGGKQGVDEWTNAWGRSMPQKRRVNARLKWWNEVLERIMPPLPREEVEELRGRVEGRVKLVKVERRKRAKGWSENEALDDGGEEAESSEVQGKEAGALNAEEDEGGRSFKSSGSMSRPHAISPRFMRRMWSKVLVDCPWLEHVDGKWKVHWGDDGLKYDVQLPGGQVAEEMFEGVNAAGKRIEDTQETQPLKA